MPSPPWRDGPTTRGLAGEVEVRVTRSVEVPAGAVRQVVQDLRLLHLSERKADDVQVTPLDGLRGHYRVTGRIARLFRWSGEFHYVLTEAGFHSTGTGRGRGFSSMPVSGGFAVEAVGPDRCRVLHYEQYLLPRWVAPVKVVWRGYIARSMRAELRDVELLASYRQLRWGPGSARSEELQPPGGPVSRGLT